MRIAGIVQDSIVDGPGFRFTVFTQGCAQRCEGCHNPQSWDLCGGSEKPVDEIIALMRRNPLTDGLTISGGEPFLQAAQCAEIAKAAHENGLNVWVYTGLNFEELVAKARNDADIKSLLETVDVLVDGAFILAERSLSLKWRGSRNQRVIDVPKSLACGIAVELFWVASNERPLPQMPTLSLATSSAA